MSASTTPTSAPSSASAAARFAVSDDLPTPPLPEATAITRVDGSSDSLRSSPAGAPDSRCRSAVRCSGVITSNATATDSTPSTAPTCC